MNSKEYIESQPLKLSQEMLNGYQVSYSNLDRMLNEFATIKSKEIAIGFAEFIDENKYEKYWIGENFVGWNTPEGARDERISPSLSSEELYEKYIQSITDKNTTNQ